jgi:hypothetical protein
VSRIMTRSEGGGPVDILEGYLELEEVFDLRLCAHNDLIHRQHSW